MTQHVSVGSMSVAFLQFSETVRSHDQLLDLFPSMSPELAADLADRFADGYRWSFNGVLVRTAEALVLVDTGFAFRNAATGTPTEALLEQAGCDSESITTIVLTHGHGDHVGGLLHDGAPAFPDAELVATEEELAFWKGQPSSPAARAFSAYEDQTRAITMDELIHQDDAGTIQAVPAPGHTPGHIALRLESGSQSLHLLADTMHATFQLDDLSLSPRFDVDGDTAAETRRALVGELAGTAAQVALFHYPFPGIGRINRSEAGGYRWRPE